MGKRYGYVVDSGIADIESIRHIEDLFLVPLYININNKITYRDLEDITTQEVYNKLVNNEDITTSQATVIDYENVFTKMKNIGYTDIFVFCMSSKLSGTINSAYIASKNINDINIHIIDTKVISNIGIILIKDIISVAHEKNLTPTQILEYSYKLFNKLFILFFVNSLDYLNKGGRVKKTEATISKIFNIKPILSINNGTIEKIGIERSLNKTIIKMCNITKEYGLSSIDRIILLSSPDERITNSLERIVKKELAFSQYMLMQLNSVILSHTGPFIGAIIAIFK